MKRIKFILIFVFANTLIFEIFSLSMCEMFSLCNTPSYSLQNKQKHHWIDHEIYGVWHKENSEFLLENMCQQTLSTYTELMQHDD